MSCAGDPGLKSVACFRVSGPGTAGVVWLRSPRYPRIRRGSGARGWPAGGRPDLRASRIRVGAGKKESGSTARPARGHGRRDAGVTCWTGRTTATKRAEKCGNWWLTEPSARPRKQPRPPEPRTSRSARPDRGRSARAARAGTACSRRGGLRQQVRDRDVQEGAGHARHRHRNVDCACQSRGRPTTGWKGRRRRRVERQRLTGTQAAVHQGAEVGGLLRHFIRPVPTQQRRYRQNRARQGGRGSRR